MELLVESLETALDGIKVAIHLGLEIVESFVSGTFNGPERDNDGHHDGRSTETNCWNAGLAKFMTVLMVAKRGGGFKTKLVQIAKGARLNQNPGTSVFGFEICGDSGRRLGFEGLDAV